MNEEDDEKMPEEDPKNKEDCLNIQSNPKHHLLDFSQKNLQYF